MMAKNNAKANTKAYEIYLKGKGIECKELNKNWENSEHSRVSSRSIISGLAKVETISQN